MKENSKKEVLSLMKKDITNNFKDISQEELNHFSNNLFVLCSLKAKHINNQTIINQIMNNNTLFLSKMQTKGIQISCKNYDVEIELYTKLKNKYIKIIRNSM